jgi:putative transcriptional regulator
MAGMWRLTVPEITNFIRRLRFDNGEITQEELARRLGITRQTIIALEAGKYTPSLALAFRIARAFNKRVEDVFTYDVPVRDDKPTV